MKAHEAFPSKYVKTDDLEGRPVTVTMERVIIEAIKGGEEEAEQKKPVLYFRNSSRGMVLNRVNWDSIADLHGDDSEQWPGKKIILYPTKTQFGSKTVPCIRVRPANGSATTAALYGKPKPIVENEDPSADMDDDIPF